VTAIRGRLQVRLLQAVVGPELRRELVQQAGPSIDDSVALPPWLVVVRR
jgi:hypothetical protein